MQDNALALYKVFSCNRPWVLQVQNQVIAYCGIGVCDPLIQQSINALMPFGFYTVLFQWTLENAGDPITIENGQSVQVTSAGVGDPIPNGWWTITPADSNAFKGGTLVDRGWCFMVCGVMATALDPFQHALDGSRLFPVFLGAQDDGPQYAQKIQKFHINYTAMEFAFEDAGQKYRLGVVAYYPEWGGVRGGVVSNGNTTMPGTFLPLTTGVCVMSRDDYKKLSLTATIGQGATIANDAGGTPTTVVPEGDGKVYAPMRFALVGYACCVPADAYCGVPASLTPDLIAQRLQQIPG